MLCQNIKKQCKCIKDYNYGSDGSENYQKLETKLQDSKLSKLVEKKLKNSIIVFYI